ncbi:hypothetical protein DUT91_21475 [Phyllobacterium salinisoli]|uniref:DUF3606 domain-containing protein n=1 Tax=Phyllobacterium salinisoli TaxID=1899321 RepID=A0A368K1I8_9HYPH|nr:hypothetical protein [Phyllobacterium salinisoli]RCS21860.1 hypothetical protein DUT91_21475 [Phyllobacterium salinisoli]
MMKNTETKSEHGANTDWMNSNEPIDNTIRYLAEHTDLSPNQARELIEKHGTDREKLLKIASTMKAEG